MVETDYCAATHGGSSFIVEQPEAYRTMVRNNEAAATLLARKDGRVVTEDADRNVKRSAQLADLTVRDRRSETLSNTTITQHINGRDAKVSAYEDGQVTTPKGAGYDCAVAGRVKAAVSAAMRDGKLDPQEASDIKELADSLPNPKGKTKRCGRE